MKIPDNIIGQFKVQVVSLANAAMPKKLAAWLAKAVIGVDETQGHVDPRLLSNSTGANPDFGAGEAPDAIKKTVLAMLKAAVARIDKPLVRIALTFALTTLGPKLIDSAFDAIYGTNHATTDLVGANLTELADLAAIDATLPEVG